MELNYKRTDVWKHVDEKEHEEIYRYGEEYKKFLDRAKTERMAASAIVDILEAAGFRPLEEAVKSSPVSGDKIYAVNRGKAVAAFVLGEDLEAGMQIVGAHIDSPRLDLKPLPLYEDGSMALLKTHYYGGIKKYQWTCIPLALHGIAIDGEGNKIEIHIGDEPGDPVFYINDLLAHLASDQMQKKGAETVTGEQLNLVAGHSTHGADEEKEKEPIKQNILRLLQERYGIVEGDFLVSELEAVPAGPARDVGFDASMIAAHGHDDRVCSYATLAALLETEAPVRTAVGLFVDKEEIGSVGNTGMQSRFFENVLAEILNAAGCYSELTLRRMLSGSKILSADVNVAFDPTFPETVEKMNTAVVGRGVCLTKYTGARGKSGSSDASAEYLAEVRKIFDDADVVWQTGELGKIDQGGGGTIAYLLAEYGADVVDCGTAMLSMHAPVELVSKADAYMTFKAYRAFFRGGISAK